MYDSEAGKTSKTGAGSSFDGVNSNYVVAAILSTKTTFPRDICTWPRSCLTAVMYVPTCTRKPL